MDLIVEENRRVLQLTLNRPEKRNALNAETCSGIVKAIRSAQTDEHVGVILICAAGQVFCSGMDLDEASHMHGGALEDIHDDLFTIGANSLKPIVVCVNGSALGGGLGLVAQGHVIVAAQGAAFGLPEIKIGLWPFLVYRALEAALGPSRMLEISLTGRPFSAHEAHQWGLVHHLCPVAEAPDRAKAITRELAKASPAAISAGLEYFHGSRGKSWKEAGELARKLRKQLVQSADFKEGYEAFKHRREPHWPSLSSEVHEGPVAPTGTHTNGRTKHES